MQVKPPIFQFAPSTKTLFLTSCIPLFIGIFCDGILSLTDPTHSPFLMDLNPQGHENQERNLLIRQARDISYEAYSSFLHFITAMLIINLVIIIIQRLKSTSDGDPFLLSSNKKFSHATPHINTSKLKKISWIFLSILGYAIAYSVLNYLSSMIPERTEKAHSFEPLQTFKLQGNDISRDLSLDLGPFRMLGENLKNDDRPSRRSSSTFPFGRVLGRLNLDGASVIFSKDETHLFASGSSFFGFQTVDVSEWENPVVSRSYKFAPQHDQKMSLLLSPDGKTLFASNMDMGSFGKFDLLDSGSLSDYWSGQGQNQYSKDLSPSVPASLALSPDGTKVFVSGFGFQVWNVSKTHQIKKIKSELPSREFNLSSVGISADGKSLFLINGTCLNIYNITELDNMNLISSVESENTPCSFVQSKDKRILTVVGFKRETNKVVIERVDVTNVAAPRVIKTFSLNIESFSPSFGLGQSPKGTYLYFTVTENETSETKMMVFDSITERLLEDNQNLISKAKSLAFTSNEMNLIIAFEEYVASVQLYPSSVNDRIFSIKKNTLGEISTVPKSSNKILKEFSSSNNGKILLSVNEINDTTAGSKFTFTDISNHSSPVEINSFLAHSHLTSVQITNGAKTLCAVFTSGILVYDISDLEFINILGSYPLDQSDRVFDAIFTSDGKTCFMALAKGTSYHLKMFDLADPSSIQEIQKFENPYFAYSSKHPLLFLSKDEKTLYVVDRMIYILDISAGKLDEKMVRVDLEFPVDFVPSSLSLSPGGKTLVVKKEDLHSSSLYIFDLNNSTFCKLLNVFALPRTKAIKNLPVRFSPDEQFLYTEGLHGGQPSLLVLNISNLSSPIFGSVIQAEGGSVDNFVISDDGETAYLASNLENKIYLVNIETSNTVFLGTESFRLGEKSSTDVTILRQNRRGDYVPLMKNYRFIKASLFSTKIIPAEYSTESTFTPFPYWMTFTKESGTFAIEPKKLKDLGTYTLYTVFSTQLSFSSFGSVSNDTLQLRAIIASLVSLGYLDNDLYVIGNLETFENFLFIAPDSEKIYKILKENYFETFTVFDIVPSLEMRTSKKKLEVSTPSSNSLKIEIILTPFPQSTNYHFLKKQYGPLVPHITENKTKLSLEGSVDDVNNALKNLVVNSEFGEFENEGTITIWDHLNPVISKTLKNLSSYFEVNEAPRVSDRDGFAVQEQIDSRIIHTGEYFSVDFLNNTFIDKYSESLSFTLTLDDEERSPAPSWLTFNELGLKGTAPEEFLNRQIHLLLTVKNEFKKVEIPLTLNIKLSLMFVLKLVVKYSPYILTILGLWVFANKIFNVCQKDKYRHHQDFEISIGQQITSQVIYPISFIGQEGEESDLIWKQISKKKGMDKSEITEEIKEVAKEIPEKNLFLYHNGSDFSRKLIHQLIMNRMALWLIDSDQEKETKNIYEQEIESHLMDLVKWDHDGTGYCEINESKLVEILKKSLTHDDKEEGLETSLIRSRAFNIELLKDVIIAEAMKCQSVRKSAIFTHVRIKQEIPANWIKRFLKKNLYDLQPVEGQKMAYGIEYGIKNDVLCFSGVAEEKLCGRTLVVQITDLRHKILKEVWIHGGKSKKKDHHDEKGELEAQGKKYEML